MRGCHIKLVITKKSRYKSYKIKYNSYKHRLSFFNLDTLKIRRIKYNLILVFKNIHNLIDLQFDDFFSISPSLKLYRLRRHKLHHNKPVPPVILIREKFFSYRTISLWNQLPSDIAMSELLVFFKKKLNYYNVANIAIFLNCKFLSFIIL